MKKAVAMLVVLLLIGLTPTASTQSLISTPLSRSEMENAFGGSWNAVACVSGLVGYGLYMGALISGSAATAGLSF